MNIYRQKILAIETSCDETSVAVVEHTKDGVGAARYRVLSHVTLSQIDVHIPYGGVYPNLARREHEANIIHVISEALSKAGLLHPAPHTQTLPDELPSLLSRETLLVPIISDFLSRYERPVIDAIAVTVGPGLEPALWVGINTAKALAVTWNIPVVPVNHMEGHILSCWALDTEFSEPAVPLPAVALLISGGHTEFIRVSSWGSYEYLGGTVDDAIGEAFDKTARLMGIPYPGGPKISARAHEYERTHTPLEERYTLPRPMLHSGDMRMSFSGLKTAVRYMIEKIQQENGGNLTDHDIDSICYSFEMAVCDVVIAKTKQAIDHTQAKSLILGGGVAANKRIRAALQSVCDSYDIPLWLPTSELSTDNALMIALAGLHGTPTTDLSSIIAQGSMLFTESQ